MPLESTITRKGGSAMYVENNPFTPSFGRTPLHMAGRAVLLGDLSRAFRGNGNDPYLQTIVMGARGTGKTAILTRAGQLALQHGWVCAHTTCAPDMLEDILQQALTTSAQLIDPGSSAKLKGISIGQFLGIEWEPARQDPANWRTRITQLLDQLERTQTGLAITVDEVRPHIPEMEQLASVFQHLVREGRRVALLMAGLPHQTSQLVNSDAVSFLRRATMVGLGRIEDEEIGDALEKTVQEGGKSISADALAECVRAIDGFAYMMQLVGFRAWDASGEAREIRLDDARRGVARAQSDLERQILIPTWAALSAGDQAFCRSLAAGNTTAKAIAADMGKQSNYVSKYKLRLLEQGVIEQDSYGKLSFSLPGFTNFVANTSPA